jgi:exodeoxyribonuclease VII small subunit
MEGRMAEVGTWSAASRELDEIVASFDDGAVSVDDLVEKLERATEIITVLEERLGTTRARVEELSPRLSPSDAE